MNLPKVMTSQDTIISPTCCHSLQAGHSLTAPSKLCLSTALALLPFSVTKVQLSGQLPFVALIWRSPPSFLTDCCLHPKTWLYVSLYIIYSFQISFLLLWWKKNWPKATYWLKGLSQHIVYNLSEKSQGLEAGIEAETVKECWLLACIAWHVLLPFLHPPTFPDWVLLYQLPTGQSDRGCSSAEIPTSQICLGLCQHLQLSFHHGVVFPCQRLTL